MFFNVDLSVNLRAIKRDKIRIRGKRRIIKDDSVVKAIRQDVLRPNVSRRPHSTILYAFPSFDKCDALLYLPTTMTRHLNSGDTSSLAKLFTTHVDRNCKVNMTRCFKEVTSIEQLFKSLKFTNQLHPDRMMCVHTTKVVENKLHSSIHLKYTDARTIYDFEACSASNLRSKFMLSRNRAEDLRLRLEEDGELTPQQRREFVALAEAGTDFVVYVQLDMVFTFDYLTNKIMTIGCGGRLSSMHAVERVSRDLCDT